ncbi:hypothetical protein VYI44_09665, partial [Streptococcus anginosus]|nr:hypothetical protein [Streptococcus anginosus]
TPMKRYEFFCCTIFYNLSNRKVTTAISYKAVQFEKENERSFIDSDTIYYPIFRVFSFGIKEDFGHKLIKFKLSRRTAFSTIGTK